MNIETRAEQLRNKAGAAIRQPHVEGAVTEILSQAEKAAARGAFYVEWLTEGKSLLRPSELDTITRSLVQDGFDVVVTRSGVWHKFAVRW